MNRTERRFKVLVTGATGFVGGRLVETLAREGFSVRALASPTSDTSRLEKLDIEIVHGDVRDPGAMAKAIDGCGCVYHLAARSTRHRLSRDEYLAVNVEGTRNVAQVALEARVDRFVYASSAGVYGAIHHLPVNENTPPNPDSPYRESKLLGEEAALSVYREGGLPVVVARIASVLGPGSCNWLGVCRAIAHQRFRLIGSGENFSQIIYVDDLIDALRRCGETNGIGGKCYLIAGDTAVKVKDLVASIADAMGADASFGSLPAVPFRCFDTVSRTVYKYSGAQLPRFHRYDLFLRNEVFDTTKAQMQLGFRPKVASKEGIGRTIQWYRKEGYLK